MGKKIFGIYLAKLDAPNSEAHARLELPASPWELHDAMDKVQLQENEELYLEIDDYYGFEYLAPHLMELDASLNELNDLAGRLAVLDETEQEAFDGLLRLEIQRKVESNGSIPCVPAYGFSWNGVSPSRSLISCRSGQIVQ